MLRGKLMKKGMLLSITLLLSLVVTDAAALSFDIGENMRLEVDTTLSYTSSWRTEDPDSDFSEIDFSTLTSPLRYSQGDANFDDKGDQFLSTFRALVGADLSVNNGQYGAYVQGSAFYDTVYYDREGKFSATGPLSGGTDWFTNDYDKFEDVHGADVELLDAYLYGSFELGDVPVSMRVGRQTLFWGESLLVFGSVATAMNPLDTTLANTPGAETKELIMPTGRVYASVSTPGDRLTLASYYKWEWEKSKIDETGAFFATNNALDSSVNELLTFYRLPDVNEDDGDEYGVALRYVFDNGDGLGLYYLNYRESLPLLQLDVGNSGYYLEYEEDVEMYALSFSSVIPFSLNTNYAFEISYRPDFQVRLNDIGGLIPAYESAELLQAQINFIHLFGDIPGADAATAYLEWAYNTVLDHSKGELYADKWATGGVGKFILDYFDVMPGLDVKVPFSFAWNPEGTTSYGLSGLIEDSNSWAIGLEATYLSVYQAGLTYTNFYGGTDTNGKDDRDNISFVLKYTF